MRKKQAVSIDKTLTRCRMWTSKVLRVLLSFTYIDNFWKECIIFMKKYLALMAAVLVAVFAGSAYATSLTPSTSTVTVTAGEAASATVTGTATYAGDAMEYAKVSGPDWATLSGTTVLINPGATVAAGNYTVTIRVTEVFDPAVAGHGVSGTDTAETSIAITVNAPTVTPTPVEEQNLVEVPTETDTTTALEDTETPAGNVSAEPEPINEEAANSEAAESVGEEEEVEDVYETVEVPQLEVSGDADILTSCTAEEMTESADAKAERQTISADNIDETTKATLNEALSSVSLDVPSEPGTDPVENASRDEALSNAAGAFVGALSDSGLISDTATEDDKQTLTDIVQGAMTNQDKFNSKKREGESTEDTMIRVMNESVQNRGKNLLDGLEALRNAMLGNAGNMLMKPVGEGTTPSDRQHVTDQNDAAKKAYEQAKKSGHDLGGKSVVGTGSTLNVTERAAVSVNNKSGKDTWGHNKSKNAQSYVLVVVINPLTGERMGVAELDANEIGSSVLLNSAGNSTDHIPGYGEWEVPAGSTDGEEVLLIPGETTTVFYAEPGYDYTPLMLMPTTGFADSVSDTTVSQDVIVASNVVAVPVYDTESYSTSFDAELKDYFKSEACNYKTTIGLYIVPGEDGVWDATAESGDAMLAAYSRTLVRTLPRINVSGDNAPTSADYVLKVRYLIPKNTETRVISGDNLLEFYPEGLTVLSDDGKYYPQSAGTAKFLDETGKSELTDAMVMQIAKGGLGTEADEYTMYYDGYIVMNLLRQAEDAEPYKPVIVVKRAAVEASDTPHDTPDTPDTPTADPGSSGGGCTAGFSALALAVLGGFIAARKK